MAEIIIGCDLDGVVADFNTAYRQRLIDVTGRELIPPFINGHEPSTWYYATDEYGYTKEEDKAVWKSIIADPTFWRDLGHYPDAHRFLTLLFLSQYPTYFITTRPGNRVKAQTEDWVNSHGYPNPTILIAGDAKSKGLLAAGLKLTHFIDDRPENCLAVKQSIPSCKVFLLDHKYNHWARTHIDYAGVGITRIYSLWEFLDTINGQPAR